MWGHYRLRHCCRTFAILAMGLLAQGASAATELPTVSTPALAQQLQVGDLVFIRVSALPFRKVAETTNSWTNHVGIVVATDGAEPVIAESTFPVSKRGGLRTVPGAFRRRAGRSEPPEYAADGRAAAQPGPGSRYAHGNPVRHRLRPALAAPVLLALRARSAARSQRCRGGRDGIVCRTARAQSRRRPGLLEVLVLRANSMETRDGDAGQRHEQPSTACCLRRFCRSRKGSRLGQTSERSTTTSLICSTGCPAREGRGPRPALRPLPIPHGSQNRKRATPCPKCGAT